MRILVRAWTQLASTLLSRVDGHGAIAGITRADTALHESIDLDWSHTLDEYSPIGCRLFFSAHIFNSFV